MFESQEIRSIQGFRTYVLSNQFTEVAVVPELGARVLSIKNRQTGREWMWHPAKALTLFRNRQGDDFSLSTLAGADECIPTIAPCTWMDRQLPDHGEAWSANWQLDSMAWGQATIKTAIDLPVSPLRLQRSITLHGRQIRFFYVLMNRGSVPEKYLWALHPLMRIIEGDELVLPQSTRRALNGETWIDAVSTAIPAGGCSKLFAGPVCDKVVAVRNDQAGEGIEFRWTGEDNNTLGLWLTRGGWNGHHHLAMEPTNGSSDSLAEAATGNRCGMIPPGQSKIWDITITLKTYDKSRHRSIADTELEPERLCGATRLGLLSGPHESHHGLGNSPGK